MPSEPLLLYFIAALAATAAIASVWALRRAGSGEQSRREIADELRSGREESRAAARDLREEMAGGMERVRAAQLEQLQAMTGQLKELTEANRRSLETIRGALDARVKELQESNERKLEEMRRTVDEKLHDTLEKRLGESFKLVSERLEAVHRGLGDMQNLAAGVGDLKRVLTNVKVRGNWAELQLGALLEQVLTPDQYDRNVAVKPGSGERVEFAIRLPGPKGEPGGHCWIPIDSKFPQEDYARLQDAAERADPDAVKAAVDGLVRAVKVCARDICDKYVSPPDTTDFAIMYLGTEGLFSEVLRQPGLAEELLNRYRVVVTGPSNLAAFLSSLRMGFQTLVIEKRASEVWRVLAAVKAEFGRFGEVLDKVKKQLNTASKTLDETGRRTRAMERHLRAVEELPAADASGVIGLPRAIAAIASDPDAGIDTIEDPEVATSNADAD
jgi:DNA recombination protein RmuC